MNDKRRLVGSYILSVIWIIISLAIMGILNLASVEFDLSALKDPGFWVVTALPPVLNAITNLISYNTTIESLINFDPKYRQGEADLAKFKPQLLTQAFEEEVQRENWVRKKEAWIEKQRIKKSKLLSRMPYKVRVNLAGQGDIPLTKKARTYKRKLDRIELHLNDEWINENLPYMKVKYAEIKTEEVLTGVESKYRVETFLDTTYKTRRAAQKFASIAGLLIVNLILNSLSLEKGVVDQMFWIQVLTQISLTLFHTMSGAFNARVDFKRSVIPNQDKRLAFVRNYLTKVKIQQSENSTSENLTLS